MNTEEAMHVRVRVFAATGALGPNEDVQVIMTQRLFQLMVFPRPSKERFLTIFLLLLQIGLLRLGLEPIRSPALVLFQLVAAVAQEDLQETQHVQWAHDSVIRPMK